MPPLYSHLYRVVQDVQGNIVTEVLGTITLAETGALAVLYADAEGLFPLPNPLVNNSQYGSFSVYLDAGTYNMSFVKASYVFEDLKDMIIAEASGGVASLVGTPNQVLVSTSIGDVVLSTPQNTDPDATLQFAHLGIGTPGEAGYGLAVQTVSRFGAQLTTVGITAQGVVSAYSHLMSDRAGDNLVAFHTDLMAAGGANRWALWAGGTAPAYLGGSLMVAGAVSFSNTFTVASNMSVGGSLAVTGGLTVTGTGQITSPLGLGGAAVAGYSLTAYYSTQLAANVTIGMVGTAATYTLDVNGNIRGRAGFYFDAGGTVAGTITTTHLTATNNIQGFYCGLQGAPDARFALRSYGSSYFDGVVGLGIVPSYTLDVGGYARFNAPVGIGTPPSPSWSLALIGPILTYSNAQVNGTLWVGGQLTGAANVTTNTVSCSSVACSGQVYGGTLVGGSTQSGYLGAGYAPNGGYWIRAGISWIDTLYVGGGSDGAHTFRCYGAAYVDGTTRLNGETAIGAVNPGHEGYYFHVGGDSKFRANIKVDGTGYKPGGGPWADSNSLARYKTNIRPLQGALAQLLLLHGREWEWSPDYPALEQALPGTRTGLVIDEVESVRPQWVVAGPQELPESKALAIHGFEALAIEAIREMVARLEALEAARRTDGEL